jgi:hypothetical protein
MVICLGRLVETQSLLVAANVEGLLLCWNFIVVSLAAEAD